MNFPVFSPEDQRACEEFLGAIKAFSFSRAWRVLTLWVRHQGWRYSPMQLYEKFADRTFDLRYGVDTRFFAELATMQISSANKRYGQRYQPSPVHSLRRLLRRLGIDFSSHAFIDFGSGKGRTLLIAAELPFKQVIGVEFSAELNDCAARNIAVWRRRRAQSLLTVHCDASEFELPGDDLVLYFFNPFKAEVLRNVLAHLAASLAARPRNVVIIYLFLEDQQAFDQLHGFRLREVWHRYRIYSYTATRRSSI